MSVFKVMNGDFGVDGLISSHPVTDAFDTPEDAFRYILDVAENGPLFVRKEAIGYWVEEHSDATRRSPIYIELPYPQLSKPPYPGWFLAKMRQVKFPTGEELANAARNLGRISGEMT